MKLWIAALAIANSMDAASACQGFAIGHHETNPLVPTSCAAVVAESTAAVTLSGVTAKALERHGQGPLAKSLLIAFTVVEVGVAVHNWRDMAPKR